MSDTTKSADSMTIDRVFDAPIDLIWSMWTDPEHFARWYGPAGATVPVARMDVRIGGSRLICVRVDAPSGPMELWFTGEYRDVVAPTRLVYTEAMCDAEGNVLRPAAGTHQVTTEVRVELVAMDDRTRMVMTHVGIPSGSPGEAGWTAAFGKLDALLATST